MGTTRQQLALLLTALLTLGGVMLASTPAPVAADGGDAAAGTRRAAADRITAGDKHTCAITSEPGEDTGVVYCWGNNFVGQLGLGDTANRGDGPNEMDNNLPAVQLGQRARSISAGTAHTCAVLADHSVKCWGYNTSGQLGLGDVDARGDASGEMGANLPTVNLGIGRSAIMVTAGVQHTCALLDDGDVKCWGDNSLGQLGLGDTANRGDGPNEMGDLLPTVNLGEGRTAIAISAGASHTCAILDTHEVKCWGSGETGQLGLGDTTNRGDGPNEMGDQLPVVDLGQGVRPIAITTGRFHSCAQVTATAVKCWGLNANGQLGTFDTADRGDQPGEMGDALPLVETGVPIVGLSAMGFSTCVAAAPKDTKCWGKNSKGQLFNGDALDYTAPTLSSISFATAVAGGLEHFCAIVLDGRVRCGGANDSGQLGYGNTENLGDTPAETIAAPTVDLSHVATPIAVATGDTHTCFVLQGSQLKCVGSNGSGQLGYGDVSSRGLTPETTPAALPAVALGTGRTVAAIDANNATTCALLDNGAVKCWGFNDKGQLGLGDTQARGDGPGEMGDNLPAVDLGTGRTATQISVGDRHVCALLDDHSVKCWGDNFRGQLGLEDNLSRGDGPNEMGDALPAVNLGTGRTAVRVVAGADTTCAILDNARVKCWGDGNLGVAGNGVVDYWGNAPGEMGDSLPYIDLGTGRTVLDIDVFTTACALLDDHSVKCWGFNFSGQAGAGSTTIIGDAPAELGDNLAPVSLGTGRTATDIAMGRDHACAILDNGSMKCWGAASLGQLGIDSNTDRGDGPNEMGDNLPTVKVNSTVASMSLGGYHNCVTLVSGWTKCFGWNFAGQFGLGNESFSGAGAFPGSMAAAGYTAIGGPAGKVLPFPVAPGAPATPTVTAGDATATVTWTAPDDGGSPITGYRLQQSVDGGVHWTTLVGNTGSTATSIGIAALVNGSSYRFRVAAINAKGVGPVSIGSAPAMPSSIPGQPTAVTGTAGDGKVTVKWTAAPSNGSAITGYRIERSTNNGTTWTTAISDTGSSATAAVVTGLTNYVPVRFRVTATNSLGTGPVSEASAAITPVTTGYWPLQPARLADTRAGAKTVDTKFSAGGALKAGGVMTLRVVGRGGVPAGTKAAVLTVMVTKPSAKGIVSVYPCGSARSAATTVSFAAGATVSNTVVAKIGASGNVCLWSSAGTHVVVDVHGVHPSGNGYTPLNPARLVSNGSIAAGKVLTVKVTGRGGVSTTAKAVTLNVTATSPAATKITVYACGSARPSLPTMNVKAGATMANMTITKVGTGGAICVHSSTAAKVHVDVIGAHGSTSFKAATPTRLASKAVAAKSVTTVVAAGKAGIPTGARSAVVNITVSKATAAGSLTVYACGTTRPATTSVAFPAGTTISQTVVAGVMTNGSVCVYSTVAATITVDAVGSH